MYQLVRKVYLDRQRGCYRDILVITPKPAKADTALMPITRLLQRERLSPFDVNPECCPDPQCFYAILDPRNPCELLCLKDIAIFFNYILGKGYKLNTDVTRMMQDGDAYIKGLICFFSK